VWFAPRPTLARASSHSSFPNSQHHADGISTTRIHSTPNSQTRPACDFTPAAAHDRHTTLNQRLNTSTIAMANGYTPPNSFILLDIANTSSWAPIIGLVVVVIFCAASWFLAPKGENQTYVHRHPVSPSKLQSPPSKPCLHTKTSLEKLLVHEKKRVVVGRRVHFDSDTKPGHISYTQSHYTFPTQLHPFDSDMPS
jgi:hypothetical protein